MRDNLPYDQARSHTHRILTDDTSEENPRIEYVIGNEDQDSTVRSGDIDDPHRSLTGVIASLTKNYTVIKLLGTLHYLSNYNSAAFPDLPS